MQPILPVATISGSVRAILASLRSRNRSASAGCIFRNPDGPGGTRSAGRLVDEAGLKGLRVGDAMVSDVHANFIVNLGGATAADVHALIAEVQRRVFAFHGVRLELEVEVWPTQADDVRS